MLTRRQKGTLAAGAAFTAALLGTAVAGRWTWTAALGGFLSGAVFVALVHLRRRTAQEVTSVRAQLVREIGSVRARVNAVADRLEAFQRQTVSALEDERLVAADRHEELRAAITRLAEPGGTAPTGVVPPMDGIALPAQRRRQ
jgi:uncharacterized protein YlxW (UPF0749 family)